MRPCVKADDALLLAQIGSVKLDPVTGKVHVLARLADDIESDGRVWREFYELESPEVGIRLGPGCIVSSPMGLRVGCPYMPSVHGTRQVQTFLSKRGHAYKRLPCKIIFSCIWLLFCNSLCETLAQPVPLVNAGGPPPHGLQQLTHPV